MNIQLQEEYEQFIQTQIATGRYENAEDVIIKALKLLEEWEKGYQEWEEETRKKLVAGLASIERGDVVHGQVVMARLEEKLRKARENQG
ncbi:type II toxin-antitoxin system ParD family antitoxin [Aetokthonos hydrillicola Thurmond2011]|jgi:antitoxin ParD1/3/4|uniref:Type II toxin-antitoxin system ParD family antitoxin n=1 Tax=Aetokthonos hydrillicola Thurmond2011 TaxID=2712845 RepID=A0AAP5MEB2_9CYAN|nr:type II toxin-antitoxin system ParD family antitoxin [Aetokthonos hydrillicola]MBO3462072.1 type II toxin-antitoxin system ParD family antitoxin [Aetokthonos hydrillicola CCALA 1050]MBW4585584.1 type II toxin-antitoxin system ParD family antitoxin [Aetokthonos hydrillicola CCALA 1050]MDR9900828.1 type II toxin-antitoxin system ParD family antitoxin [Aetokthonos hydrillicola Thurmond2011]